MKIIVCLVVVLAQALAPVSAFSQRSFGVRRSSSLRMNVEEMATKKIINVGVIGMGRIGLVHLEAISKAPGVRPVIVSNPTISKAEAGECVKKSAD